MSSKNDASKWNSEPKNNLWDNNDNWDNNRIPTHKAVFSESCQTIIGFTDNCQAEIQDIEFTENAPSYNFNIKVFKNFPALTIKGKGVLNHSKKQQSFSVTSKGVSHDKPQLKFTNKASAGDFTMQYYAGPESLEYGYGGGVITFADQSTAGLAFFTIRTGKVAPPRENSTVGAEVSFNDSSNAGMAKFMVFGTLGKDGDTFGNAVFHDKSSASQAAFTNIGGTVHGGDGGNTQFYDETTAAFGTYDNYGGNVKKANGGDVAFDGVATAGHGLFYNRAAKVEGAFGGVTSFNNNPNIYSNHPHVSTEKGATAGNASFHNFGASKENHGGGGHTEFTAKFASCTGGHGKFYNYGSVLNERSSAGHTIFSISRPSKNFPTAGNGTFYNYPSPVENGVGGFTEFSMYDEGNYLKPPTAGNAIIINLGGTLKGASGGYTSFSNETTAENATLIAHGGTNDGHGGRILFNDDSLGENARIELHGNGELDLSYHRGTINFKSLVLNGGVIKMALVDDIATINLSHHLDLSSKTVYFSFFIDEKRGFEKEKPYPILSSKHLEGYTLNNFKGTAYEGIDPIFTIVGKVLFVTYTEKSN